jgi:hypothetical protein
MGNSRLVPTPSFAKAKADKLRSGLQFLFRAKRGKEPYKPRSATRSSGLCS